MKDEIMDARELFAQRLKFYRLEQGYRTARGIARALGIHENRYTRYERAEVEPDLALLMKICSLLEVTPNMLLCGKLPDEESAIPSPYPTPGPYPTPKPDDCSRSAAAEEAPQIPYVSNELLFSTAAWQLADELANALETASSHAQPSTDTTIPSEPQPARVIQTNTKLFRRLISDPFSVLPEIGELIPIHHLSLEEQKRIATHIKAVVKALREAECGGKTQ